MALLQFNYESLAKDLAQQGYPNYFLITGSDLLLQKEASEQVQKVVTDTNGYYACEEVELYTDADNFDLKELLLEVNQVGLFGVRKFIKIIVNRNLTTKILEDLKALAQANDKFHVYAFILLNWERKNEKSALYKTFKEQTDCAQIICEPLKGDKYRSWIRRRLRKYNFVFEDNVINFLFERFENNMFTLQQLLEQLKLREIKEITIALIEQTSQEFSDYGVFDLMPYVVAGKVNKACQVLDYLVYQKKESIGLIIGAIRRELFNLYTYRFRHQVDSAAEFMTTPLVANGFAPGTEEQFRRIYWDKEKRRIYEKYLRTLITRDRLYRLFIYLCDIDIASKTCFNLEQTLEHLRIFFEEFCSRSPFSLRSCEIFKDKLLTSI
ncbi:DNA polymerase III subunit delta [Psittacicella gerlachiana]|uniref:DNA polymerase III subunit delta n=1 Tax=Psittacicella gerlachiana TaxID=2028574 RepID=A0A3A1YN95_9GAMM|nr:DNA polymerase III subunit delta [Psittacicella gerlachiana]RIY37517.1 DNA polymerase III subunit delta [Psittacicella gerlachiana]